MTIRRGQWRSRYRRIEPGADPSEGLGDGGHDGRSGQHSTRVARECEREPPDRCSLPGADHGLPPDEVSTLFNPESLVLK